MELQRMLAVVKNPNIKRETLNRYANMLLDVDHDLVLADFYQRATNTVMKAIGVLEEAEENGHGDDLPHILKKTCSISEKRSKMDYLVEISSAIFNHPKADSEIEEKVMKTPYYERCLQKADSLLEFETPFDKIAVYLTCCNLDNDIVEMIKDKLEEMELLLDDDVFETLLREVAEMHVEQLDDDTVKLILCQAVEHNFLDQDTAKLALDKIAEREIRSTKSLKKFLDNLHNPNS